MRSCSATALSISPGRKPRSARTSRYAPRHRRRLERCSRGCSNARSASVRAMLDEVALAKSFGISRGPVREACRALVELGLLALIPNRGVFGCKEMTGGGPLIDIGVHVHADVGEGALERPQHVVAGGKVAAPCCDLLAQEPAHRLDPALRTRSPAPASCRARRRADHDAARLPVRRKTATARRPAGEGQVVADLDVQGLVGGGGPKRLSVPNASQSSGLAQASL